MKKRNLPGERRVYRCDFCEYHEISGRVPPPPALPVFPLPKGWELVSTPLGQDDKLQCQRCIAMLERVALRVSTDVTFMAPCLLVDFSNFDAARDFFGCSRRQVLLLALCRRPRASSYAEDIAKIAEYVRVDESRLRMICDGTIAKIGR
jgi:hypothetical protein